MPPHLNFPFTTYRARMLCFGSFCYRGQWDLDAVLLWRQCAFWRSARSIKLCIYNIKGLWQL